MSELEVFWVSGSPYAWRVLLALELKRAPYRSRLLERSKGETRAPEYLALNPRGKVPAVRDGDVVVYESLACVAYVDRKHPEPPLFGRTPAEAARVWREVAQQIAYVDEPFEAVTLPLWFGRADEEADRIRAHVPHVVAELARLEAALARDPWLAGAAPSAADCFAFPFVRSLERGLQKPAAAGFAFPYALLRQTHPAVGAWMARVEALPGYDRTFPPHWR